MVKLSLNEAELPKVDSEFEEITEGEEEDRKPFSTRPSGPRWKHSSPTPGSAPAMQGAA